MFRLAFRIVVFFVTQKYRKTGFQRKNAFGLFFGLLLHLNQQKNDIMSSSAIPAGKDRTALFNALVLRHKTMIWHVCSDYNLGKSWSTEDCMQEVMANLWRSFDQFEGRSSEKTWVWRVATNTMLMLKRKDVRSPQTESIEQGQENAASDDLNDENLQQLTQLIDALPEENATAIRAFLDGFSYKEIADMTGSTVGAVAMRIARTKRQLKRMYEEENTISQ